MTNQSKTEHSVWQQFCASYWSDPETAWGLDLSRMEIDAETIAKHEQLFAKAFKEMVDLESGAIANPDENRQVGHYWLRAPELTPSEEQRLQIEASLEQIQKFTQKIHTGKLTGQNQKPFKNLLLIGIGGSALGPQLLQDAFVSSDSPMQAYFIDNTDPDGIDRILDQVGTQLDTTLVLIVSKSGGTKETRNGMLAIEQAYLQQKLSFGQHSVAVTGKESKLEKIAKEKNMLAIFPMWDWVGGRTSLFSAVGMLPAALLGIDIQQMRLGAAKMDQLTRIQETSKNPAALLSLSWFVAGEGKGIRDMVVLPYKDRLLLLSRYLQQLIMESLGKTLDREGNEVHQGIVVYGNKGSTDQHAFVQQLREGPDNFFVNFIQIRQDRLDGSPALEVEPDTTNGDYLTGFFYGTREALWQKNRHSITLTLPTFSEFHFGMLIALYERAVSFYASLVNINAYHQPGVEGGKKAAGVFLELQQKVIALFKQHPSQALDVPTIAEKIQEQKQVEAIFYIVEHFAANKRLASDQSPIHTRTYRWNR